MRHLPKCFDNIHNLEFAKDEAGNPTKTALGMYSGEGEYVPFAAPCSCDGPVEVRYRLAAGRRRGGWGWAGPLATCRQPAARLRRCMPASHLYLPPTPARLSRPPPPLCLPQVWLQNVVDAMRTALSHEFKAIIPTYDERPRTKWILENSVQNTVVVSRLFFTAEVSAWLPPMLPLYGAVSRQRGLSQAGSACNCLPALPGAIPTCSLAHTCPTHTPHAGERGV